MRFRVHMGSKYAENPVLLVNLPHSSSSEGSSASEEAVTEVEE